MLPWLRIFISIYCLNSYSMRRSGEFGLVYILDNPYQFELDSVTRMSRWKKTRTELRYIRVPPQVNVMRSIIYLIIISMESSHASVVSNPFRSVPGRNRSGNKRGPLSYMTPVSPIIPKAGSQPREPSRVIPLFHSDLQSNAIQSVPVLTPSYRRNSVPFRSVPGLKSSYPVDPHISVTDHPGRHHFRNPFRSVTGCCKRN